MSLAPPDPPRRPVATRSHGVHRFLGRLHERLDELPTATLWALSADELSECLQEAYAAQARLSALTLALVAQAETGGLASREGLVNTVAWLRQRVRLAPADARRQVALAHALEQHDTTRAALAAGAFPTASAEVVVKALDALPADLDADLAERAEQHLVGEAHTHDTAVLRRIGAHLDEVLDPEGADQRLAEQLARAEADAQRQAFLTLRWHQGGRTDLRDGVLICRPHHTYADHPDYQVTRLRPGRIRINRRQ